MVALTITIKITVFQERYPGHSSQWSLQQVVLLHVFLIFNLHPVEVGTESSKTSQVSVNNSKCTLLLCGFSKHK